MQYFTGRNSIFQWRRPRPCDFSSAPSAADYEALGRFIASCSAVEVSMHELIRTWLPIEEWLMRALIEEPRVGDLVKTIKLAIDHQNKFSIEPDTLSLITSLCNQVTYFNSVRSIVAHKPFLSNGISLLFHNTHTAKSRSALKRFICTTEQLVRCSEYAQAVANCFAEITSKMASLAQPELRSACQQLLASVENSELPVVPGHTNSNRTQELKRKQKPPRRAR